MNLQLKAVLVIHFIHNFELIILMHFIIYVLVYVYYYKLYNSRWIVKYFNVSCQIYISVKKYLLTTQLDMYNNILMARGSDGKASPISIVLYYNYYVSMHLV